MSIVKLEVQLSSEELLKAVEQLNQVELERFVSQIIILQAQRKASSLPQTEAELLLKINQGISSDTHLHFNELIAKREAENLTSNEHRELLYLTEQIEKLQTQRIEYLVDLARLRGISLTDLMKNLGIQMQMYV